MFMVDMIIEAWRHTTYRDGHRHGYQTQSMYDVQRQRAIDTAVIRKYYDLPEDADVNRFIEGAAAG